MIIDFFLLAYRVYIPVHFLHTAWYAVLLYNVEFVMHFTSVPATDSNID